MSRGSILIIEDDHAIREMLSLVLQAEGYPVLTAANGEEGLSLLEAGSTPSLIILDLMMPVMNGWEFADKIAQNKKFETFPIVLLTAFAVQGGKVKNAKRLISKPIEIDVLLETVKEYCG